MVEIEHILSFLKNGQAPIENTVDELLFGNPNQVVSKIATTFNASIDVIRKAISQDVELIISHEGIYYTHRGIPKELHTYDIYKLKNTLITEHNLAIFRYHDYIHSTFPDPITAGLVEQLDWHKENVEHQPYSAVITFSSARTLDSIVEQVKAKLNLSSIRITGSTTMLVNKAGVLVGYRGGAANALPLIEQYQLDLLIVGEAQEWETAEYIMDCNEVGINKAMITIGHMASEAYGMDLLAKQLQQQFPMLSVTFLENNSSYQSI